MKALNKTKNNVIVSNVVVADTMMKRFWGLMGRKELPQDEGLLLKRCNNVHSCFMKIRFDAIFLSKEGRVVGLCHSMKPWRISKVYRGAADTLEVNAGVIESTGIELGDIVSVEKE